MPTTLHENRPSAGRAAKTHGFCDFCAARATLCGDRRGRGAKTHGFCDFCAARATLCGDRRGRGAKTLGFFCDFCGARATLCANRRGGGAKTRGFCDFCCSNWSSGVVSWFARLLPEPAGCGFDSSLVRGRASQDATCILKQLAQSNLHSATCVEQLAQTQLAPTSLRRAPCLVLSRACFTNASCREKERILQRWADLACDVLLSGQPWSSFSEPPQPNPKMPELLTC